MLEKLFKKPWALARHKNTPFLEERERFLIHKEKEGYAQTTLTRIARELFWVSQKFQHLRSTTQKITLEEIQRVADKWAQEQFRVGKAKNHKRSRELLIHLSLDWFRFLGRLNEPVEKPKWYTVIIEDFAAFMKCERGLSQNTVHNVCRQVEKFLYWYNPQRGNISSIQVKDVDKFLKKYGCERWSRISTARNAQALRVFFRYAAKCNLCSSHITDAIKGPRLYTQENIPSGPSWEDVKRLIGSMETEKPCDVRDRAIAILFAIYGMRSSEVSNLRLEDINWKQNQIAIVRKKQRRSQIYPLIPIAGNAIIKYLQLVRPRCIRREIFLTLRAPIKALSNGILYNAISRRIVELGIRTLQMGPHALRHACATHLLSRGLSFKEIADHLGHRSINVTQIYAKVDLTHLREVADFNFGGVL